MKLFYTQLPCKPIKLLADLLGLYLASQTVRQHIQFHNSHDASVSAGVPGLFQMHYGQ